MKNNILHLFSSHSHHSSSMHSHTRTHSLNHLRPAEMNFDWIDLDKPGEEKLMGHNVWIGFQAARESACPEDLLNTLQQEAETSASHQHD